MKQKSYILLFTALLFSCLATAQNKYLAEFGLHGGAGILWNRDAQSWSRQWMPNPGMMLRYNADDRFSMKLEWNSGIGRSAGIQYTWNHFDLTGSFNFLEFEKADYKLYSSNLTPYLMTGLGMSFLNGTDPAFFLPMGAGIRMKIKKRYNIYLQAVHRFYLPQQMAASLVYPDYSILRNNTNVLNNDQFSTLTVGLSYDFWERPCNCMKNKSYKNKKY